MEKLIASGVLTEIKGFANCVYILKDSRLFSLTGFKVIQNHNSLVRCARGLVDGKMQFVFMTEDLRSLKSVKSSLDEDSIISVIRTLLASIIDIKNQGHITSQNIALSTEKIFIDPDTKTVKLIYLPLESFDTISDDTEAKVRKVIVDLLSDIKGGQFNEADRISTAILMDEMLTVEDMYEIAAGGAAGPEPDDEGPLDHMIARELHLVIRSDDRRGKCEFHIDKPEFIIGRRTEMVDGVIPFNQAVGRVHCKITSENGKYFVTDLSSRNGTFVNGRMITPNQPTLIEPGDRLTIADSDFTVGL